MLSQLYAMQTKPLQPTVVYFRPYLYAAFMENTVSSLLVCMATLFRSRAAMKVETTWNALPSKIPSKQKPLGACQNLQRLTF
eukprot:4462527-Amphidinium_carterae.1